MKYKTLFNNFLNSIKNLYNKLHSNISNKINEYKNKNYDDYNHIKHNGTKRYISIKYKILIIIASIVLVNILINILFINLFMNNYYISSNKKKLESIYSQTLKNYNDNNGDISTSVIEAEKFGISVRLVDEYGSYTYRSSNFKKGNTPTEIQNIDSILIQKLGQNEKLILTVKDQTGENYNIYFVGKIGNSTIILSSSVTVIKETSAIARTFIVISSFITFVIIATIIYLLSKKATKKIDNIKQITKSISNLDFSKKVQVTSNDEIGELLTNINTMSDNLENAILKLEDANKKLKNENQELEKIEKMRKQLITNISHEFKTPLTLISGYNQLLKNKFNNKEDLEYVDIIISETEKLNQLVVEFLDLSKIENNNIILKPEKFNLSDLVYEYLNSMKIEIDMKKISIQTDFIKNTSIVSDIKCVEKIISNLIGNAIKYVDNENIIKLSIHSKGDNVVFNVFNTCENINEDILNNIWNTLYKTTNTRSKNGTGLGLTIVKSLCEILDCKYSVENVENGVEFTIEFKKNLKSK